MGGRSSLRVVALIKRGGPAAWLLVLLAMGGLSSMLVLQDAPQGLRVPHADPSPGHYPDVDRQPASRPEGAAEVDRPRLTATGFPGAGMPALATPAGRRPDHTRFPRALHNDPFFTQYATHSEEKWSDGTIAAFDAGEAVAVEGTGRPCHERPEPATLAWLRQHQNSAGYWCPRDYRQDSTRNGAAFAGNLAVGGKVLAEAGSDSARVEATAQALLTFAGSGYDHKEGDYKQTCRMAILWLRSQLVPSGCVGTAPRPRVREQAFAAAAMSEMYGLSGDIALKPIAESMLEYLLWMRRPGSGWGESISGEPNVLDTTLAIFAIKTARMAGLEPASEEAYREAREFLSSMVVEEGDGRCHVRFNRFLRAPVGPDGVGLKHGLPVCEAAWVVSMLFTGQADLNSPQLQALAAVLCAEENKPRWEAGRIDYLYWWLATSALFQVGGKKWSLWEGEVSKLLLNRQRGYTDDEKRMEASRETLDEYGSWDPIEASCAETGRVGATALAGLTLQIYFRYLRLKDD